jgi:hypothetical protein
MPRVLAQAFSKALIPPALINPEGRITGTYYDANNMAHGFLRDSNGTMITFDAPGAGTTGDFPGTYAVGINPKGASLGIYTDANNSTHGLLRASDGIFTTFDPPGSIAISILPFFLVPFSFGQNLYITPNGVITGTYKEPISGNPFGGNYRVLRADPQRHLHHIRCSDLPPLLYMVVPLRY